MKLVAGAFIFLLSFCVHSTKADGASSHVTMMKYYSAALDRYSDNEKMTAEIKRSQTTWESYAEANCDAVWTSFGEGSYRNQAYTICVDELSKLRTHAIWSSFLGFVDTTPSILPEPKL